MQSERSQLIKSEETGYHTCTQTKRIKSEETVYHTQTNNRSRCRKFEGGPGKNFDNWLCKSANFTHFLRNIPKIFKSWMQMGGGCPDPLYPPLDPPVKNSTLYCGKWHILEKKSHNCYSSEYMNNIILSKKPRIFCRYIGQVFSIVTCQRTKTYIFFFKWQMSWIRVSKVFCILSKYHCITV